MSVILNEMDAWRRNDEFDGRLHPDLPEIGMLPFRHQIASVSHPSLRLGGGHRSSVEPWPART
jgi:hypothetical protein